jgi:hypothetical protein
MFAVAALLSAVQASKVDNATSRWITFPPIDALSAIAFG